MEEGPHLDLLREAIAVEAGAQRMLIAGDPGAREQFARAAALYRESWTLAPPRSFGRLVGMLKAQVLAGDAVQAARYVRDEIPQADSPPSAYALAVAALVLAEDERAADIAQGMRGASEPFERAAAAITALASRDQSAYQGAIDAIVADFAGREDHLTGVRIADTALMLDELAAAREMAVRPAL